MIPESSFNFNPSPKSGAIIFFSEMFGLFSGAMDLLERSGGLGRSESAEKLYCFFKGLPPIPKEEIPHLARIESLRFLLSLAYTEDDHSVQNSLP
jgi:hypothetical protein